MKISSSSRKKSELPELPCGLQKVQLQAAPAADRLCNERGMHESRGCWIMQSSLAKGEKKQGRVSVVSIIT